ncbi:hypothetical protein BO86DRAFT_47133 [Aspergillus japonicus CBS 114.51]|uniref:Uncharacterized protein n=1 Tax=Aspergillus japonicus CBS 114.51 TaxID=1448312 RepID=A0A8T8X6R3_ASPJA|nr:hypothetical protein BO86DRAFT_47133 [Aspergillus japonicus CBS 114.51]RAH83342.1 hypothetical protein BO86DRAFT_47133 [Aspergillus japonicus CBS 114.51]
MFISWFLSPYFREQAWEKLFPSFIGMWLQHYIQCFPIYFLAYLFRDTIHEKLECSDISWYDNFGYIFILLLFLFLLVYPTSAYKNTGMYLVVYHTSLLPNGVQLGNPLGLPNRSSPACGAGLPRLDVPLTPVILVTCGCSPSGYSQSRGFPLMAHNIIVRSLHQGETSFPTTWFVNTYIHTYIYRFI